MSAWTRDDTARSLLEVGPFETQAFRLACINAHPRWQDVSIGARLDDGTHAALALLRRGSVVESMPYGYGGVRSTRTLTTAETVALFDFARTASGAATFDVRAVGDSPAQQPVSQTHVVALDSEPLAASWSPRARQSIRRCERAGGELRAGTGVGDFISLYSAASTDWQMRYPTILIEGLWDRGALRVFEVHIGGEVVSASVALVGSDEWMYWFGAQNDLGRRSEAGYLALSGLLMAAQELEVRQVNLGGSAAGGESLSGVQSFKERFGGVAVPVTHYGHQTVRGRATGRAKNVLRAIRHRVPGTR